jgi:hypothetical protein
MSAAFQMMDVTTLKSAYKYLLDNPKCIPELTLISRLVAFPIKHIFIKYSASTSISHQQIIINSKY